MVECIELDRPDMEKKQSLLPGQKKRVAHVSKHNVISFIWVLLTSCFYCNVTGSIPSFQHKAIPAVQVYFYSRVTALLTNEMHCRLAEVGGRVNFSWSANPKTMWCILDFAWNKNKGLYLLHFWDIMQRQYWISQRLVDLWKESLNVNQNFWHWTPFKCIGCTG